MLISIGKLRKFIATDKHMRFYFPIARWAIINSYLNAYKNLYLQFLFIAYLNNNLYL